MLRCAWNPPHLAGLELPAKAAPGPTSQVSRELEAKLGARRKVAPYLAGPV